MKKIELASWPGKAQFEWFCRCDSPLYHLCMELDVLPLYFLTRREGLSLFSALLYCVSRAANDLESFRMRCRSVDEVVVHDAIHASFTLLSGDDTQKLGFVPTRYNSDFLAFCHQVSDLIQVSRQQPELKPDILDNKLYVSSIPWLSMLDISHPVSLNRFDSVPRITWGKLNTCAGRYSLPICVQVHHGLVDGRRLAEFFQLLQQIFNQPHAFISLSSSSTG